MGLSMGIPKHLVEDFVQEMYLRLNKYVKNPDKIMYNETEVNKFYVYITIKNLYNDNLIPKLTAIHILSSRDDIQGGEFRFKGWNEPTRIDNYGKVYEHDNPYPTWLNEKGTLFVVPALEPVWSEMVVSGELNFVQYVFRGVNYR